MALVALLACNDTKKTNDNSVKQNTIQQTTSNNTKSEKIKKGNEPSSVILGTWTGEMNQKKLTLVVEKINGTELVGYNILGSNKRPLKGSFTDGDWDIPCSKAYQATLSEPGDEQWDGVFAVKFVGYEDEKESEAGMDCVGNLKGIEAIGEWKSNNGKMKHAVDLIKKK